VTRLVGANVVLAEGTKLGDDVTIGNNVTLRAGVAVGDGCTIFDGATIGRAPLATGTLTRPLRAGTGVTTIGRASVIGANAVIYTDVSIGERVLIGDLASIREGCTVDDDAVVGRGVMLMYDVKVGPRVRIIDGAILTGGMILEADVFIGPGVMTVNDNDVYLKRFGLKPFAVEGPIVRRFAVVGTGANIAAGVEIGVGAIVAPQAMVTHDVAPWTVVAGVPAKLIRAVEESDRRRVLEHFGLSDEKGLGS
jgi:acetyltransferase-like isoleucine patch superfamily enzyme